MQVAPSGPCTCVTERKGGEAAGDQATSPSRVAWARALVGGRARRTTGMLGAVALVAVLATSCGSSSQETVASDATSAPTSPDTTVVRAADVEGPLADLVGTWTQPPKSGAVEHFCAIGQAIGPDGVPKMTEQPTATHASGCRIMVRWTEVDRVTIGGDGPTSLSFTHRGAGSEEITGTCTATAKVDGQQLQLDDLACDPATSNGDPIDFDGLVDASWQLAGSCLVLNATPFAQSEVGCLEYGAEDKFDAVGDAIGEAN